MKKRMLKKWLIIGRTLVSTRTSNVSEFAVTIWAISQAGADKKFENTYGMRHAPAKKVDDNLTVFK